LHLSSFVGLYLQESGQMAGYVGDVAIAYDRDLGDVLFEHYAADIARRATERSLRDVLEIAAGTGIVTRQLRNALPKEALLTAIDISDSMVDVARTKFLTHEQVTFQIVDATALPFRRRSVRCGGLPVRSDVLQ
jgi:ubiquinone/menaquinone biosynthesis C-methylase UbiE